VLGHEVDESRGLPVTNAERALQKRCAAALLADDDLDGLLIERVALSELLADSTLATFGLLARLQVQEFAIVVRRVGGDGIDDAFNLRSLDQRSLRPHNRTCAWLQEEHVALVEQLLRALLVEHDGTIGPARHLEADACWQVRLDEAGDNIDRRL